MSVALGASYRHCRRIARKRARNFYYSFVLLDEVRRNALSALYAFMRRCDDLSDDPAGSGAAGAKAALEQWRKELDESLAGRYGEDALWPALCDAVSRYRIPRQYLYDMIDGVSSDLERSRIETFEELYRYCYQVASVVGLSIVHVFGFESPGALPLAEKCGIAFQLTNILRDVREDAERNRVYIPVEDLARFGVEPASFQQRGGESAAFRRLMAFEAGRAREYYQESAPLVSMIDGDCRASLWALIRIYSRLLERIEEADYTVLRKRIRVSSLEKFWILLRALAGQRRRGFQARG